MLFNHRRKLYRALPQNFSLSLSRIPSNILEIALELLDFRFVFREYGGESLNLSLNFFVSSYYFLHSFFLFFF